MANLMRRLITIQYEYAQLLETHVRAYCITAISLISSLQSGLRITNSIALIVGWEQVLEYIKLTDQLLYRLHSLSVQCLSWHP